MKEFIITKKDGTEKDVRDLIYSVEWEDDILRAVIGFGNGIRIEKFTEKLLEFYGGEDVVAIKTRGLNKDGKDFEDGIK